MQVITCVCGQRFTGTGAEELFEALRVHVQEAHPAWGMPDQALRDLAAERSGTLLWDGRTVRLEGELEIQALRPDRVDDFLGFFDRDAFMDNPLWSSCYCMAYLFTGSDKEWAETTAAENREAMRALILGRRAHGYLAYVDGRPVGWCHAATRVMLPGLNRYEEFRTEDPERVGAIVCFVIAAPYRRQGVARRLLDAACEGFRREGLAVAEAYPLKEGASDARAYHGPLAMYLAAGFNPYREGKRFVVVRKSMVDWHASP
ncbi:MAG: GNAT family N-acetyltransferase [Armatimonadetes bacterium]|nr:GNAT family N-acetyltransferase [Armatimonadota bacterium]